MALLVNYCPTRDMMPLLGGKFCGTKRMTGFYLFERGVKFTGDLTKTTFDTSVQEGKVIGFVRPDSMEDNNSDPNFTESSTLVRSQQSGGRKGWRFTFFKSNCFQNELSKLNGSEDWAFAPVLEDGSIVLWKNKANEYLPFSAKTFVGIYNLPLMGADQTGSTLEIDLVDSLEQWQNNGYVVTSTEFDFNEVLPVAGLNIQLPVLTAADTTTTARITNLCSDAAIIGLTEPTKWKMERNGTLEAVTAVAYDAVTGEYTFTHAALVAGDEIAFLVSDNGNPIYVKDTSYYSGKSDVETVA